MVVKHFLLMLMMNSKLLLFCTGGQAMAAMSHDFPLPSSAMQDKIRYKYLEYVGNLLEYI